MVYNVQNPIKHGILLGGVQTPYFWNRPRHLHVLNLDSTIPNWEAMASPSRIATTFLRGEATPPRSNTNMFFWLVKWNVLILLMVQKSQTTTWHVWNPVNNGINYHINWCRIFSINSRTRVILMIFVSCFFLKHKFRVIPWLFHISYSQMCFEIFLKLIIFVSLVCIFDLHLLIPN